MTADPDVLSMTEAAAACGVSRERFRKVWRRWARELCFPAPFMAPPDGPYAWRASGLAAWKAAREAALGAGRAAPATNDNPPPELTRRPDARLVRERAELKRLMQGG